MLFCAGCPQWPVTVSNYFTDRALVLEAVIGLSPNHFYARKLPSFQWGSLHSPPSSAACKRGFLKPISLSVGPLLQENCACTEGSTRSTVSAAFPGSRKIKRFLLLFLPVWSTLAQTSALYCLTGHQTWVEWQCRDGQQIIPWAFHDAVSCGVDNICIAFCF